MRVSKWYLMHSNNTYNSMARLIDINVVFSLYINTSTSANSIQFNGILSLMTNLLPNMSHSKTSYPTFMSFINQSKMMASTSEHMVDETSNLNHIFNFQPELQKQKKKSRTFWALLITQSEYHMSRS